MSLVKLTGTLGFLRRNLRILNEETKTLAYKTIVRPSLEYCSMVWNPYTKEQTRKIEMVQRRAARYVTNRYHNTSSVTNMLDHLGWESLESRRTKAQLTMLYKITNGLVDIPADRHLTPGHSVATRSAHAKTYLQPSTTTTYYRNSFFPRTVTSWNQLPAELAEAPDLVSFKRGLGSLSF